MAQPQCVEAETTAPGPFDSLPNHNSHAALSPMISFPVTLPPHPLGAFFAFDAHCITTDVAEGNVLRALYHAAVSRGGWLAIQTAAGIIACEGRLHDARDVPAVPAVQRLRSWSSTGRYGIECSRLAASTREALSSGARLPQPIFLVGVTGTPDSVLLEAAREIETLFECVGLITFYGPALRQVAQQLALPRGLAIRRDIVYGWSVPHERLAPIGLRPNPALVANHQWFDLPEIATCGAPPSLGPNVSALLKASLQETSGCMGRLFKRHPEIKRRLITFAFDRDPGLFKRSIGDCHKEFLRLCREEANIPYTHYPFTARYAGLRSLRVHLKRWQLQLLYVRKRRVLLGDVLASILKLPVLTGDAGALPAAALVEETIKSPPTTNHLKPGLIEWWQRLKGALAKQNCGLN